MGRRFLYAAGFLALFLFSSPRYALAEDKTEGRYFTIYFSSGLDSRALAQQLNISPAEGIIAGENPGSGPLDLAAMMDTLFLQVCNILDMQMYSFHGSIKICLSKSELCSIYRSLFSVELGPMKSFYVYSNNTIYLSSEEFRREIIGHEIAHAVISHYFVVSPSVKIQEVLSGYVEYQLRKVSR